MIMTIDAGNTRTKWAIFNQSNGIVAKGVFNNQDSGDTPEEWAKCAMAVISNVAGDAMAARLKTMLAPIAHQHWISALVSGFGIKNGYLQPELLGSDRWAAMVGARQYTEQSCIVVNAGTALTVDAMQRERADGSHTFIGGIIVPGWHMMQQSLVQGTDGINHALPDDKVGTYADFPRNTEDAIHTGSLLAMVGAIEQMSLRLQRQSDSCIQCMMSGGDALMLAERLRSGAVINDIVVIEDLVLRGLLVIGREIR